ncbi:P35 lipoprotein homolog fragment [Malacoplasma penetrans HF-2]|uniref:P35 lipoprotein homolog n=1 Tax=Malacoplasma penetrans (strain HF-2) TaxID=272633 RepID=Q8EVB3_MALP2|nr:P35 lipoprotein homolog fragment [Malacoplasma penetrans HF-2]
MKIKKIKLLKALAMTGAFGIIATVPVIVSSCSSTSDNNGGNGDTNQGGEQSQTIIPQIKSSVTLSGALTDIYNPTDISKTNSLIADEIKNNLADVFDNGSDLTNVSDLEVSVTHTFPASTWTGLSFDSTSGNWKAEGSSGNDVTIDNANKLVYSSESQLNISSLSDLKTQLDDTKLKEF